MIAYAANDTRYLPELRDKLEGRLRDLGRLPWAKEEFRRLEELRWTQADPDAEDPVQRESTRVTAAAVHGGQTSIDPKVIEPWLGPNVLKHRMINMAVGEKTIEDVLANYDQYQALYREFSPYKHLDGQDPPLLMTYGNDMSLPSKNAGHGIHHPVYGVKMKEKSDQVGHECYLLIPGVSSSERYPNANAFLIDKLLSR